MESRTDQLSKFANEMYKAAAMAAGDGFRVRVKHGSKAAYVDLVDPETGAETPVWSWVHDEEEK